MWKKLNVHNNHYSFGPLRWEGKIHTAKNSGVDASTEPPNQTANLWMGWLTTLTSTGCDWRSRREREHQRGKKLLSLFISWIAAHILYITKIEEIKNMLNTLTFISPPSRASDARTLASTIFFKSRCNLLWKSLNMVEPPDSTIFWDLPHKKRRQKQVSWVVK